jgi:Holliday junction resolvase-like predicted endonuclease
MASEGCGGTSGRKPEAGLACRDRPPRAPIGQELADHRSGPQDPHTDRRAMARGSTAARARRGACPAGECRAAILRHHGWQILVEYTFNHFGDRGSVDLIGWHQHHRSLVLVEVKSRIADLQDLHAAMARKRRIVPTLLVRERGWQPSSVGQLLVAGEASAQRRLVARHAEIFRASFPHRGREARSWLAYPAGPLSALWFLSPSNGVTGKRLRARPERVRSPNPRSARTAEAHQRSA